MVFMSWSSKTWSQENDCQDLANQCLKSNTFLFKTWHAKFWNVTLFCKSMFPSLDNDCTIQDLVFQVLKPFGVINFSIRPKEELCSSCLGLPRHDDKKMIVKTWQTNFWNLTLFCSRLGLPSFEMLHCFANICKSMFPIIGIDCTIQDLVFLVLNPFWGN